MFSAWSLMVERVMDGWGRQRTIKGSGAQQFAGSEGDGAGNFAQFTAGSDVTVADTCVKNTVDAGQHPLRLVANRVNHLRHQITDLQGLADFGREYHQAGGSRLQGFGASQRRRLALEVGHRGDSFAGQ